METPLRSLFQKIGYRIIRTNGKPARTAIREKRSRLSLLISAAWRERPSSDLSPCKDYAVREFECRRIPCAESGGSSVAWNEHRVISCAELEAGHYRVTSADPSVDDPQEDRTILTT
jgi:hypothetical protein